MTDEFIKDWTFYFTGLGAIAALIAAVGVWWAARTFKFSTWLKAQAIYTDKDFYNARKAIFSNYPNELVFTDELKDDAILVCQKMDELAHLKWYVGEEKIIKEWGHQMAKAWKMLEKFVECVRNEEGYLKKWKAFEDLAKKAAKKN